MKSQPRVFGQRLGGSILGFLLASWQPRSRPPTFVWGRRSLNQSTYRSNSPRNSSRPLVFDRSDASFHDGNDASKVDGRHHRRALTHRIFITVCSGLPSSQIGKTRREFERVGTAIGTFLGHLEMVPSTWKEPARGGRVVGHRSVLVQAARWNRTMGKCWRRVPNSTEMANRSPD